MIKRIVLAVIGVAVLAAAAGTAVVALAFALYAVLTPQLGPAGAAASVAGAAALLIALIGLIIGGMAKGKARPKREPTLVERLTDFARERPAIAAAGALAAGLIALKNPKLAAGLASAFMAGKAADQAEKPRRRW